MLCLRKLSSRVVVANLNMGSLISVFDRGSHRYSLRHCTCRNNHSAGPCDRQSLAYHRKWLTSTVPSFNLSGEDIHILKTPSEFYNNVKNEAQNAKRRVVLSSLYLGTGQLEKDLVKTLEESLQRTPGMNVNILLDYTRGSRGKDESSRTMLLPLLKDISPNVHVALYHTPNLRGWLKAVLPERYNETLGLQHMKIYLFDDNVILSGANLSESYFTNRQDRYVIFRNAPHLANFFTELVQSVSSFSMHLTKDNHVQLASGQKQHPYKDNDGGKEFRRTALERISTLLKKYTTDKDAVTPATQTEGDTWVFPMLQMGQIGVNLDQQVTQKLIRELPENSKVRLASGYFNLTNDYIHDIVHHSLSSFEILTASPLANGFFGARGFAGAIPDAYTYILKQFFEILKDTKQSNRISLYEYFVTDWTFHAKGMWCYLPEENTPSITLIGSPNFGYRSRYRDLEAQVAILTENENLKKELQHEQSDLYHTSSTVTQATFQDPQRRIPLWVKMVTNVIKHFF